MVARSPTFKPVTRPPIIKMKARTAPAQARNIPVSIQPMFQWACDQHAYGIKFNPAAMLKPTALCGDKVARDRRLSDEEVFAFSRAAQRMRFSQWATPINRCCSPACG